VRLLGDFAFVKLRKGKVGGLKAALNRDRSKLESLNEVAIDIRAEPSPRLERRQLAIAALILVGFIAVGLTGTVQSWHLYRFVTDMQFRAMERGSPFAIAIFRTDVQTRSKLFERSRTLT